MKRSTAEVDVLAARETNRGSLPARSLLDRLRAEAIRALEGDQGAPFEEPEAREAAVEHGGDFEARVLTRARHLSVAPDVDRAVGHVRSATAWVVVLVLVVAFLLGAGTARTTMAAVDGSRINFFWVLGGVLGIQTLLLLVWAGVAFRWALLREAGRPRSPMLLSLGHLAVSAGQWVAAKMGASRHHRAATHAAGAVLGTGRIGFWTFSSLTHAIWLAFNFGALALIVLLLSARQYTFVWETTILSERHYVAMTEVLSAPARAFGFSVPTDADIAESQWTGEWMPPATLEAETAAGGRSQRWASLLAASILLYGAAPRLLLLGLSAILRQRASRGFRLDLGLPEYERLRPLLMPPSRSLGVVDPDLPAPAERDLVDAVTVARPTGPPAIVGVEIGRPGAGWPPPLDGIALQDLGIIESREDRARTLDLLAEAEREPGPLVMVCELTTTPDRGIARTLESLRRSVHRSPFLILTGGQSLRQRGYDAERVQERLRQWREVAEGVGVEPGSVLAVDLDHFTDVAAARLAEQLGGGREQGTADAARLVDAATAIEQHVEQWLRRGSAPTEAAQLALHREIASLYRRSGTSPSSLFSLTPGRPRASMEDIKAGVTRFVDLLPPRLRANPRWLAAGALAGALGCVATAALISPVAVAALPSWSVIGAGIAAALKGRETGGEPLDLLQGSPDLSDAVRASALLAVVLELQGRDEGVITRVLDRTFASDSSDLEGTMTDLDAVSSWLGDVRRRFDRALAREEGQ
jgi:hypothetical protein